MNPSIHRKKLIKWKKRMESVSEKEGSKEDETRLGNNMVYLEELQVVWEYEHSPADAVKKMLLY